VTPGFLGHSKHYITSKKFLQAEGGIKRLVWMPKSLKEALADRLNARGKEEGIENFVDLIADETVGLTQEEILPWLKEKGHPALDMDPIM
jgi:acetyl-CoA synthase